MMNWKDNKGRSIEISSMSDGWLNNIRKKFKGSPLSEPIVAYPMKMTKESIKELYPEITTSFADHWTFNVHPYVDFYYNPITQLGTLVTGSGRMGNVILFKGRVQSTEELKFLVESVSYFTKPPSEAI
jgi:hypothetical protein